MNNIDIRPLCPADAPFLTVLMNHPTLLHRLHQVPASQSSWEDSISLWNSDPDEEGYILFESSDPIGWFAINSLLSPIPYIKIAVLLPEYQNRGIGQAVLRKLLSMLESRGYAKVRLYTDCDNLSAQACYRKCGFRVIATAKESWPNGAVSMQYEMEVTL